MRPLLRFTARWLAAGLLLSIGLFGGTAIANHQFSDVSGGFHSEISWLVDNGIATGFNDGTFRPKSNVTRGQAAFWFSNYNDATADWKFSTVTKGAGSPSVSHEITCPNGKRPLAGGGQTDQAHLHIRTSRPKTSIGNIDNGWHVTWNVIGASFPQNAILTVYVLCAPPSS